MLPAARGALNQWVCGSIARTRWKKRVSVSGLDPTARSQRDRSKMRSLFKPAQLPAQYQKETRSNNYRPANWVYRSTFSIVLLMFLLDCVRNLSRPGLRSKFNRFHGHTSFWNHGKKTWLSLNFDDIITRTRSNVVGRHRTLCTKHAIRNLTVSNYSIVRLMLHEYATCQVIF